MTLRMSASEPEPILLTDAPPRHFRQATLTTLPSQLIDALRMSIEEQQTGSVGRLRKEASIWCLDEWMRTRDIRLLQHALEYGEGDYLTALVLRNILEQLRLGSKSLQ